MPTYFHPVLHTSYMLPVFLVCAARRPSYLSCVDTFNAGVVWPNSCVSLADRVPPPSCSHPTIHCLQDKIEGTRRVVPKLAGARPRTGSDQTGDSQNTVIAHPALHRSERNASDSEQTANQYLRGYLRGKKSFEEWATETRKSGRVDSLVTSPKPSLQERPTSNTTHQHDLERVRVRAHKALLAGNFTDSLEMCQRILQQWPSDPTTLVYQGEAMAQNGELDIAWNSMVRVLALSNGVEATANEASPVGVGYPTGADDSIQSRDGVSPELPKAPEVPQDIALSAAAHLAMFASARAPKTMDENLEIFFLVEGLRGSAERNRADYERNMGSTAKSSSLSSESGGDGGEAGETSVKIPPTASLSDNTNEDYGSVGRADGYTNVLLLMAQAFGDREQLMVALRLYQRVILLGEFQDQSPHVGLAEISSRLLEKGREKTHRRSTTRVSEAPTRYSSPSPPSPSTPPHRQSQTGTGQSTTSASVLDPPGSSQQRRGSCEWEITHPRPGQVFSPKDTVQVKFDLMFLDPGLTSAGSLFKTVAIGGGTSRGNGTFPADVVQEGGRGGIDVTEDGLGFIVCSYLQGFTAAHCLPQGQLRGIGIGWHILTAEVYQLPSLRPFSCPAGGDASKDGGGESRCARVEMNLLWRYHEVSFRLK